MALKKWIGGAAAVAQVTTITFGTIGSGNTYSVICNGKTISFLSTTATAADIYAGLAAAILAAGTSFTEFKDFIPTSSGSGLVLTGSVAGYPFTVTASASTGTNTVTPTTAASGPNDASTAANWEGGTGPSGGDDLELDLSTYAILHGLLPGVNYASITITAVGQLGLPVVNSRGYREYRTRHLTMNGGGGSITVTVRKSASNAATLMNLSLASLVMTGKVYSTGIQAGGTSQDYPLTILNPGASSTLFVQEGRVQVLADSSVTITSLRVIGDSSIQAQTNTYVMAASTVNCGAVVASGNVEVEIRGAASSCDASMGSVITVAQAATCPIVKANAAKVVWASSAGITTSVDCYAGGQLVFTDGGTKAVEDANIYAGGLIKDSLGTVTWTNGIVLSGCRISDVSLDVGVHRTLTPS